MIPTFIIRVWPLCSLVGFIGGAIYLAHEWQQPSSVWDLVRMESVCAPNFGANHESAMLVGAVRRGIDSFHIGRPDISTRRFLSHGLMLSCESQVDD